MLSFYLPIFFLSIIITIWVRINSLCKWVFYFPNTTSVINFMTSLEPASIVKTMFTSVAVGICSFARIWSLTSRFKYTNQSCIKYSKNYNHKIKWYDNKRSFIVCKCNLDRWSLISALCKRFFEVVQWWYYTNYDAITGVKGMQCIVMKKKTYKK